MLSTLTLSLLLVQPVKPPTTFNIIAQKVDANVRPLAFAAAPTGSKVVMSLEDNSVVVLDTKSHKTVLSLVGHPQPCNAVAWSPNGKLIASGDESARVILWDAKTGKKIVTFRHHGKGIQALGFSASSGMLISTGKDDAVNIYTLKNNKRVCTLLGHGDNLYGASFMGKGFNILCGTLSNKGAEIFGINGKSLASFGGHGGQGAWDAALNPAGSLVATGGRDGDIGLWNLKTKKKSATLKGHTDWVMHTIFAGAGRFLISSSVDSTVRIWNVTTGKQIHQLNSQTYLGSPICVTADGRMLLTVNSSDNLQYNAIQTK
jgi:WD40 repeat protein